jgi:hypothetical protein
MPRNYLAVNINPFAALSLFENGDGICGTKIMRGFLPQFLMVKYITKKMNY